MEWSEYSFAKAIHRITHSVLENSRLSRIEKIEHLEDLMCLMVLKLPEDWYTETKVEAHRDCDAQTVLNALDRDLRRSGYQPSQYAVFGALRKLVLTIQDLQEQDARLHADERSTPVEVGRGSPVYRPPGIN